MDELRASARRRLVPCRPLLLRKDSTVTGAIEFHAALVRGDSSASWPAIDVERPHRKVNSLAHCSGVDVPVGEADMGWSRARPPSPGKVIVDQAGDDVP
jgi:hypothetical protein